MAVAGGHSREEAAGPGEALQIAATPSDAANPLLHRRSRSRSHKKR